MKSIITEAIDLVGGRRNALHGMAEGLPLIAYIIVFYFAACAIH